LGTQGLLKEVAVKHVKAFEEHFLTEMVNKHADILAEFKKGKLEDASLKTMVEMAKGLMPQYK
jgi:F-type H+-transporting ATPase subunit alpha